MEQLISTLLRLLNSGKILDVLIVKGGCLAVSLNDIKNIREIVYEINRGYNNLTIKPIGNKAYTRKIDLNYLENYKLTKNSLTIKQIPLEYNDTIMDRPSIKVKW